jgi:hypothetical protein
LIILLLVVEEGAAKTDLAAMMPVVLAGAREDFVLHLVLQLPLEHHTRLLLVAPVLVRVAQPLMEGAVAHQYFLLFHLPVAGVLVLMLQMEFLEVLAALRELMDRQQKLVVLEIHRLLHPRKEMTEAPELEIAVDQEEEALFKLGLPEVGRRLEMGATVLRQEQV